jgi:UDP-N-acetylglucosamine 4,6-dehydratase
MKVKIKQVSEKLGIPVSTIRHWQSKFCDFVNPEKTKGGQRIYSDRDVAFLSILKDHIHGAGKSIAEVTDILRMQSLTDGAIDWSETKVLIIGGTGSFGRHLCKVLLEKYHPKVVRIYSRDELKQHEMQQEFQGWDRLRFFIGDVRDGARLKRAMEGVDLVVHAAALKQVPACEYNPFEAIKTNVLGAQNVIDGAIDSKVKKVIALSTDKAVNPVNLYGATKLCSDKIFIHGNAYSGDRSTRFSCVRYGNVIGSRGSVIPLFKQQKKTGVITLTDERMTRFWITLDQAVDMVIKGFNLMKGGEIFIPKLPSMKIVDLAEAIAPGCKRNIIGIRAGEKLHEVLMTEDDGRNAVEVDDMYVVKPCHPWWEKANFNVFRKVREGFVYSSDTNEEWVGVKELKALTNDK